MTINNYCKKAYEYFVSNGMTKEGACALLGNLYAESGIIANRVEILCLKRLKENGVRYKDGKEYTDATYTKAVDEGFITKTEFMNPLPGKQYGYGLNQATSPNRKALLYSMTVEKGKSIADEAAQLEYIMYELEHSYQSVLSILKTTKMIKEASDAVLRFYEIPANWEKLSKERAAYGQEIYNALAKSAVSPVNVLSKELIQKVIDDAVAFAVDIANDNKHGYSQVIRSLFDITDPKSFDCSSLVLTAFYYAFVKNGFTAQANYLKANCSYTGNMMRMLNCGFEVVATNQTAHKSMVKGDVELNETHHTALAIDNNRIVHARSSEGTTDTIDGSGNEIRVQEWYNYSKGWTHRLRFTGKGITSVGTPGVVVENGPLLLKRGSKGSDVKALQQNLNKLINAKLDVDGDFGTKTEKAVKTFQKQYSLEVDGIVGAETKGKITELLKALQGKTDSSNKLNETEKKKGYVTTLLNVRVYAGTEYGTCSFSPLATGTIVSICDTIKAVDGSDWHYIKYQGKYGFVSAKHIGEQ